MKNKRKSQMVQAFGFLYGIARTLDIGCTLDTLDRRRPVRRPENPFRADAQAIAGDWQAVGDDWAKVSEDLGKARK
jgi:hypothetical protein